MNVYERIYPEFLIHTQTTGRWSTVRPPLAQLPSDLQDIIKPDQGTVWLGHDWDQIELRLQAALANDTKLLEAFSANWDIHTMNMCDLFSVAYPPDRGNPHLTESCAAWRADVGWKGKDDTRRVFGKRFVFRLIYRGNPRFAGDIPGAAALGLTAPKLVKASQQWLLLHPAIRLYWSRCDAQVRQMGYTETWAGRKRRLLGVGQGVAREASNFPMQGGVADIYNLSMIELVTQCPWLSMVYGVHDSFWMACATEREAETWPHYQRIVQQPRLIEQTQVRFPASFKRVTEDGVKQPVPTLDTPPHTKERWNDATDPRNGAVPSRHALPLP